LSAAAEDALSDHVIIAGYGVAGRALAHRLQSEGMTVVVVDLNTRSVGDAESDGFQSLYGDIATPEVMTHLGAQRAVELVLLINDASALERAVEAARRTFPSLVITVRSRYQGEVAHLKSLGATHVVAAEVEAGRTITEQVLRRSIPAGERAR
jgi:CPA2 family monovalent cation:H+ antiporter-2